MTVALYTHPDFAFHAMAGHPECPQRLLGVMARLQESGVLADLSQVLAREVTDDELAQVHPRHYIAEVGAREPADGAVMIEVDTYMSPGSLRAAKLAAGANLQATLAVLRGDCQRAFCAIRPPGHHAEIAETFGYCLFNNVALAAEVALHQPGIERVAIVDFDVHHCNGTVDIFKDRDEVMVCSSFQQDYYPFRFMEFENEHIIATPLPAGTRSDEFRRRIESSWLPALERHRPDLVLISAGFDAHREDPLADIELQDDDYTWITQLLVGVANDHARGRIVSTLEGGYNLQALARCAERHLQGLLT